MRAEDVEEVVAVDHRCSNTPWPASAYRQELGTRAKGMLVVLRRVGEGPLAQPDARGSGFLSSVLPFLKNGESRNPDPVVGYAGLWIVEDEAHITTIAVLPELRGRGLGELLLVALIEYARARGATWLTLEARVSNTVAQALYRKYTFKQSGYRKRYYSDNGEDAVVMWSDRIDTPAFEAAITERRARLEERLDGALLGMTV